MIIAYSELGHVVTRHVANKVLDAKQTEGKMQEIVNVVINGFPFYGVSPSIFIIAVVVIIVIFVSYSIAGKGTGSHAGREEVRRAYRRKLAQEMAKEDAEKIRSGEKKRRKWMQW